MSTDFNRPGPLLDALEHVIKREAQNDTIDIHTVTMMLSNGATRVRLFATESDDPHSRGLITGERVITYWWDGSNLSKV